MTYDEPMPWMDDRQKCRECDGTGEVIHEHEIYHRQGFDRDVGYVSTKYVQEPCEDCNGTGETNNNG